MNTRRSRFFLLFCLALAIAGSALAQSYNPFNERDDTYRLLGLKRAKQAYETARTEFGRQDQLY